MRTPFLIAALAALLAQPALAAPDCAAIQNAKSGDDYLTSDWKICKQNGWEPGKNQRPAGGLPVKASGGGGFAITNTQSPDMPPAAAGAKPTIGADKLKFSFSFPPWKGFPCQLPGGTDLCSDQEGPSTGAGTSTSSCPVADDTSGAFGTRTPLTGSGRNQVVCGGAIPLSTYPMTLTQNAIGFASTEYNSYYLWAYTNTGTSFASAPGQPMKLPTYLCKPVAGDPDKMVKSVDLMAPRQQIITYNATSQSIAVRLIAAEGVDEQDPLDTGASTEKYLIIPLKAGIPQVPADCANEDTYYKPLAHVPGDIIVETNLLGACEGTAAECAAAGAPTTPTAAAVCETSTIYPSGTTATSAGDISCDGKTLLMSLDRPNLLHPPGVTETHLSIDGRTGVMAISSQGSQLFASGDTIIRLNRSGQVFTFNEGGTLALTSNQRLIMYGPVTFDMNSGTVTLTNGGETRDQSGTTLAVHKAGTSFVPPSGYPYTLLISKSVTLPPNYYLPTQPSPYIRAPIDAK